MYTHTQLHSEAHKFTLTYRGTHNRVHTLSEHAVKHKIVQIRTVKVKAAAQESVRTGRCWDVWLSFHARHHPQSSPSDVRPYTMPSITQHTMPAGQEALKLPPAWPEGASELCMSVCAQPAFGVSYSACLAPQHCGSNPSPELALKPVLHHMTQKDSCVPRSSHTWKAPVSSHWQGK